MRKILLLILLAISMPTYATRVKCWAQDKIIFNQRVNDVLFDKEYVVAKDKSFTYVIYNADCVVRYSYKKQKR